MGSPGQVGRARAVITTVAFQTTGTSGRAFAIAATGATDTGAIIAFTASFVGFVHDNTPFEEVD